MEKKNQKEELQSRREFFKKAGKGVLPILGMFVLASNPVLAASTPNGCGCGASCSGACDGCSGGCQGSCKGSCDGACMGSCKGTCSGTCKFGSK